MSPMKQVLGSSLFGLILFGILASILQWILHPIAKTHPNFPFITLEDRYLPFFNKSNYQGHVYSWYALDDYLAWSISQRENPLENISAREFSDLILQEVENPKALPIPYAIQEKALALGGYPFIYEVKTNDKGFRGEKIQAIKVRNTMRLVAAGDSLTFGFGVAENHTWVSQMQKSLKSSMPSGLTLEVINAGVISFDSILGAEMIRKKILRLQPNWVILGYGFNDYNFNNRNFLNEDHVFKGQYWQETISSRQSVAGQLSYFLNQLRVVQLLSSGFQKILPTPPSQRRTLSWSQIFSYHSQIQGKNSTDQKTYTHNMDSLILELKRKNIKILLLHSNLTSPFYLQTIRELAKKHDIPMVDFRETFFRELNQPIDPLLINQKSIIFRVRLSPEERIKIPKIYVLGDYFSAVEMGATPLNDQGKNGDEQKNDGVYSGTLKILEGTILSFRFAAVYPKKAVESSEKDWHEEFQNWRIYRRLDARKSKTPIYLFNDLNVDSYANFSFKPFMSEICHPNQKGNEILARAISQTLIRKLDW